MSESLTKKQEAFVQGLIKGKSQREAYKAAYSAEKMSDSTIDSHASRLLKDDKVRARYDKLKGKVVAKAEEQTIMSVMDVLRELESIAKDDISNYLDFRTEKTLVGYEDGEPIFDYRTIVELKDSRTINTKNISEVSIAANGAFKFKMYDRQSAINKLLEVYGENAIAKAKQKLAEERFAHDKDIDSKRYW